MYLNGYETLTFITTYLLESQFMRAQQLGINGHDDRAQ